MMASVCRAAPTAPLQRSRSGACLVEFAIVGPLVLMMLISLVFAGLATFRYTQLSNVSRHAARWAAVHGKRYTDATKSSPITKQDVYEAAIRPRLIAAASEQLEWDVEWSADGRLVTVSLAYSQPGEAMFVGGTIRSSSTMFVVR